MSEEYRMGTCPSAKQKLEREPQVSSEINGLNKSIAELSAILSVLEQKLTPILPNINATDSPQVSAPKAGPDLVPLAYSIYVCSQDVQRLSQRIATLNSTVEI